MQSKICNYIAKIKGTRVNGVTCGFTIGDEAVGHPSDAKYFKITFTELRTDVGFVQLTPTVYTRTGYIKIDSNGNISLTDDKSKPYRSSTVFSFNEDADKLVCRTNDDLAHKESFSSRCIKLGFFALGAAAVGTAIVTELMRGNVEPQM